MSVALELIDSTLNFIRNKQSTVYIPPVLILGHPRLRDISRPVSKEILSSTDFKLQSKQLKLALKRFRDRNGFGRAMSAIQINIDLRMIAMNLTGSYTNLSGMTNNESFLILNPKILYKSENNTLTLWDDCMSFPDLLVKVQRYCDICIEWMDIKGNIHKWTKDVIKQDLSELLQHEMDHLDGVLSVDRAIDKNSLVFRNVFEQNKEFFNGMVDYNIYAYLNE